MTVAVNDFDRSLRVLRMVHNLHLSGYERLRVCPGISVTGSWRCFITPASNMFDNGWQPMSLDGTKVFAAEIGPDFFGWERSARDDHGGLAVNYLFRFTDQLACAEGRDPKYVQWFADMLGEAEQGRLPIIFDGGTLRTAIGAKLPPSPVADVRPLSGYWPYVRSENIALESMMRSPVSDEAVAAFALSFDGYLWAEAAGRDLHTFALSVQGGAHPIQDLDEARAMVFYWQRCAKWSDTAKHWQQYMTMARAAMEDVRRLLSVT